MRDPRAPTNKQQRNVSQVVQRELTQSKGQDTLVLGAPSVDISNQYALKTGKVKQVILLDNIPWYDTEVKDKDKPDLANLANKELFY